MTGSAALGIFAMTAGIAGSALLAPPLHGAGQIAAAASLAVDPRPLHPAMAHEMGTSDMPAGAPLDRLAFQEQMRRLWEDHIVWTRLYIISVAGDLPDKDLVAQRLLRNQVDIGDAITPFYGEQAGNHLTTLLQEHILDAAALLEAATSGDQAAIATANATWYANADAIAAFLHAANPDAWPLADLQAQMRMHLDVTLQEATDRLHGEYAADIADFDRVEDHILALADLLSSGIIQQFPRDFA
jgi:hypothetical protein